MVTRLSKPVVRAFEHDGAWYKVAVSGDGIRITRKNARLGSVISWEELLALGEEREPDDAAELTDGEEARGRDGREHGLGVPESVAADVLVLMGRANEMLSEASSLIDAATSLPALLARHRDPPAPPEEDRSDWYLEPLLTLRPVSRLLGVSSPRVRRLPLRSIDLNGEIRYQPAEVRRFFAAQAR